MTREQVLAEILRLENLLIDSGENHVFEVRFVVKGGSRADALDNLSAMVNAACENSIQEIEWSLI